MLLGRRDVDGLIDVCSSLLLRRNGCPLPATLTQRQHATLVEVFATLDEDRTAKLRGQKIMIALSVLGFTPEAIDVALMAHGHTRESDLTFDEFTTVVTSAISSSHDGNPSSSTADDSFPLPLLAKTHAISQLIDSYDTRHLDIKLQKSGLLLPSLDVGVSGRLSLGGASGGRNQDSLRRGSLSARRLLPIVQSSTSKIPLSAR